MSTPYHAKYFAYELTKRCPSDSLEKLAGAFGSQRNERRRLLFDAQDQVDKQREDLISPIEGKLPQQRSLQDIFTIRWRLA